MAVTVDQIYNSSSSSSSTNRTTRTRALNEFKASGEASIFTNSLIASQNNSASRVGQSIDINWKDEEKKLKAELDSLKAKQKENDKKIKEAKKKIEEITKKIEKQIKEASRQQDSAIKNHERDVQKVIDEQISNFLKDKKDGKNVTKEDLDKNIRQAFPNAPDLADAVSSLTEVKSMSGDLESLSDELNSLYTEQSNLKNEIADTQVKFDYAREEARKDPMGFDYNGDTYEFVVGDKLTSMDDFLGAENQWDEMMKLDTNGDGSVDIDEFEAGNINLTNSKGEISGIRDLFGDNFSVDLSSYQDNKNGNLTYNGKGMDDDIDGNGIKDNKLINKFNVNINNETVEARSFLTEESAAKIQYGLSDSNSLQTNSSNSSSKSINYNMEAKIYNSSAELFSQNADLGLKNITTSIEGMKNRDESMISRAVNAQNDDVETSENENAKNKNPFDFSSNNKNNTKQNFFNMFNSSILKEQDGDNEKLKKQKL